MNLPKDPIILLSYVNTQLRDFYPNLNEMCKSLNVDKNQLVETLKKIDYSYQLESNQFK
jgi:hypothetical protein